jgi:hypothetical protein
MLSKHKVPLNRRPLTLLSYRQVTDLYILHYRHP